MVGGEGRQRGGTSGLLELGVPLTAALRLFGNRTWLVTWGT